MDITRIAEALRMALSALETPGDLTDEELNHVIEDGGEILAEYDAERAGN